MSNDQSNMCCLEDDDFINLGKNTEDEEDKVPTETKECKYYDDNEGHDDVDDVETTAEDNIKTDNVSLSRTITSASSFTILKSLDIQPSVMITPTISQLPWVEELRPRKWDMVVGQDLIVKFFQIFSSTYKASLQMPHVILYGPPGTGKTSTIDIFAKTMYGSEYSKRVLKLTASNDRNIEVIRSTIRSFIISTATGGGSNIRHGKIVILDEADSLNDDSQAALRRTMEKYYKNCIFIIICNRAHKIIEPLRSRCFSLKFLPLTVKQCTIRLTELCVQKDLIISEKKINALVQHCNGDLRTAVTSLHSCHQMSETNHLEDGVVDEVIGVIPTRYLEALSKIIYESIRDQKQDYFKRTHNICKQLKKEAYSGDSILSLLMEIILNDTVNYTEDHQSIAMILHGHVTRLVRKGANEHTAVTFFITHLINLELPMDL